MTEDERSDHMRQNDADYFPKIEAGYTICNKTSVSGNQSIVEYLFDQGKCGDICKDDGKCLVYFNSRKLIFLI